MVLLRLVSRHHTIKVKMDMLSLCRKRTANTSSAPKRRSDRIADFQNKWTSKTSPKNIPGTSVNVSSRSVMDSTASTSSHLPAISEDKDGNIVLRVWGKPGAKQNAVTDIQDDCVGIQIAAPARAGQANYELVQFLASVLQLRKSNISIDKGLRSRIKSVIIVKSGFTPDQVTELLRQNIIV